MRSPIVVGAGVCGLAAGAFLHRAGHDPTIVDGGQGTRAERRVVIGTNGMRVLYHLGVADAISEAGQPLSRARILDPGGRTIYRLSFETFDRRLFDCVPVSVDRATLIGTLEDLLPAGAVEFGRECTGIAHQSGTEQVTFANGDIDLAPLLIGADGATSTVRSSMFPAGSPRDLGLTRYQGVATDRFEAHLRPELWQVWGPGTRVEFSAIDGSRVGWSILLAEPIEDTDGPSELLEALSERCSTYPEPVRTLLARTSPDTLTTEPVLETRPLERWHGGGSCLAGDAAHAAAPWIGVGQGLGLVDAYTIAERLRSVEDDVGEALAWYEEDRKPTAEWFQTRSRRLLRAATLTGSIRPSLRNRILRVLPERLTHRTRRRMAAID